MNDCNNYLFRKDLIKKIDQNQEIFRRTIMEVGINISREFNQEN